VIVAASSMCFAELPFEAALQKLDDLEYSAVEIAIHESGNHIKPSDVAENLERAVLRCRDTHRLQMVAYNVDIAAEGDEFYRQFQAICALAKATKVVTLVMASSELGTPFNEEVERLRKLVGIASVEGVLVAVKTETGRMTEDPDTVRVLCDNVDGLGITLDPSHFIIGPHSRKSYEPILKYTYHVHLRDTKPDALQVRVGQGEIEYNRLVTLLQKYKYNRALSVDIRPLEDVDHMAEMRKFRLLLESLL